MLKLTIPQQAAEEQIDWSKPQWVCNEAMGCVVITNGIHEGSFFEGAAMPCKAYPEGAIHNGWTKEYFRPLTIDIPFTISNKD